MKRRQNPSAVREPRLPPPDAVPSGAIRCPPALIWASIPEDLSAREADCEFAPSYEVAKKRKDHWQKGVLGISSFWDAAKTANKLLLYDIHFTGEDVITLRNELENAHGLTEVRIISAESCAFGPFKDLKRNLTECNRLSEPLVYQIRIVDRQCEYACIHDRFAVTGEELWHFGGTVGCLEGKVTAVSRGWDANEKKFIGLFDKIWEKSNLGKV